MHIVSYSSNPPALNIYMKGRNTIGKPFFNHIEILKKLLSIVNKSMEELINLMVYTIKIFIFEIKKAKYPGKREKQFKIGKKIIELSL